MIRQPFLTRLLTASAMALSALGHVAIGAGIDDPANLTGERVRTRVAARVTSLTSRTAAFRHSLAKLRTRASLMLIVAHPDDEDGGMLTYESIGNGARVATLTLTRGEGGQNLVSSDLDDALGLIRTQELLAADRYMDVDQMFGTEVDFGFSKSKEEAFARWTHERVLYDAVRAVRLYRPLVLVSAFSGAPTDGHGQHQVAGQITQEVFTAAADPTVFPEMGLEAWAPLKVYERVPAAFVTLRGIYDYAINEFVPLRFCNYVTKTWSSQLPTTNLFVHEGSSSDLLGMSYVQLARKALEFQKTQIRTRENNSLLARLFSSAGSSFDVGYHRYGSRIKAAENEQSFFDGIDVSVEGIATLAPSRQHPVRETLKLVDEHVARAERAFTAAAPELCAPELREGLKALDRLIATVESGGFSKREKTDVLHELRIKRAEFNDVLAEALGLRVEARMEAGRPSECSAVWSPGCTAHFSTKVINQGKAPVTVTDRFFSGTAMGPARVNTADETPANLNPGNSLESLVEMNKAEPILQRTTIPTRPYFSRRSIDQAYYHISDPALRLAPETPGPSFWVRAWYGGVSLLLGDIVFAPRSGAEELDSPLQVVPSLSLSITPASGAVPLPATSFPVGVDVRSNDYQAVKGSVRLLLPFGWRSEPINAAFALHRPNETQRLSFRLTPHDIEQRRYRLTAVAQTGTLTTQEGYRTVGYPGLIPTNLYTPATYIASMVDVKVTRGLNIAYVSGSGDEVQRCLEDLGLHVTTLTIDDVVQGRLGSYDVVVLGVQAYSAHPELVTLNDKLLAYAKAGGVLIAQYDRGHFDYGPYPLSLGVAEKVVEETAPVKLLMPNSPLLTWPNRITQSDFDDWVEERGHGFMASWDQHYQALLETHDSGQNPQKGALLATRTGKGMYIYVALALYRQLPQGVPGAYRLFANLLSAGKPPTRSIGSAAN